MFCIVGYSLSVILLALVMYLMWGALATTLILPAETGLMGTSVCAVSAMSGKLFLVTVGLISLTVMFYSESYMDSDLNSLRFILLVLLFVLSMLILILSGSWLTLILGWDGLGLSSYFLVVFYLNYSSNSGGLITILSNRVGDVFIILFIIMSLNISCETMGVWGSALLLSLIVLSAAITKSAMFPFISWLPEAMAAPTPVSSLVHSSTLVTAGVYLISQMSPHLSSFSMALLMTTGSLTLLISSLIALLSQDMKKVVALSTLSQLSLMMLSASMGLISLAFFHLISHAMFKSCLFLSVGAVMHMSGSSQESRLVKSLSQWSSMVVMSVSLLCLMAAPFTSAYYTKESILLMAGKASAPSLILVILMASALFTMAYSSRFMLTMLLASKSGSSNPSDSSGMHLFTPGLLGLSVLVGVSLSPTLNLPYQPSGAIVFLVVAFMGGFLLIVTSGPINLQMGLLHLATGLKAAVSMFTPLGTSKGLMLSTMNWEAGLLVKSGSSAWHSVSTSISGAVIIASQVWFTNIMMLPMLMVLTLLVLY